jgi:hypothetical protein
LKGAEKLLESMGLSLNDPGVELKHEREPAPMLQITPAFGGVDGFRGILKIAYEYARGVLEATIVDAAADQKTRDAILAECDPADFVRWLPFERLPGGYEAPFYSHRLVAWQGEGEVLVIVEFFNILPFVVHLPGLRLPQPAYYIQGVQGERPIRGAVDLAPTWTWQEIPEHAQLDMLPIIEQRMKEIGQVRTFTEFAKVAIEALAVAFEQRGQGAPDDDILELVDSDLAARALRAEHRTAIAEIARNLLPVFRASATSSD